MEAGGSADAVVWKFVPGGARDKVVCAMPKSGIINYNTSVGTVFYPGAKVGVCTMARRGVLMVQRWQAVLQYYDP